MERPIFNPHMNITVSKEATDKFKSLEPTQKQIEGTNYLTVLRAKHVYAGTANPNKVARRRAKNKVAGHSRKKNRMRGGK